MYSGAFDSRFTLIMHPTGVRESHCVVGGCRIICVIKALTYLSVSTYAITSCKRKHKQVCVTLQECSDAGCSSLYKSFAFDTEVSWFE